MTAGLGGLGGRQAFPDAADPALQPPTRPPARGLTRNMMSLAASQIITWTMTLAWTLVVPRLLGAQAMGVLVTAISATAILGVILGLPTREYLAREMVAQPERAASYVGTAMSFRVCLLPVFVAAVALYASLADIGENGIAVLYLMTAATFCSLLADPALAGFQSLERMEYISYSEVLNKSLTSVGGIVLAVLGVGVFGLTAFGLAVSAVSFALAARWIRRLVGIDLQWSPRRMWAMARASAPYWTFGVFYMIYLWIDAVMLGVMAPEEVVGWYGVATRLFTTMMFLPVIISTAFLPRLVMAFQDSYSRLATVARVPLETVFILSLPICTVVLFTARPAINVLYGGDFSDAGPVLMVLGLCLPPMYVNIIFNQILIAAKRPTVWAYVMAGATVGNPAINYFLIRHTQTHYQNGAIGAAYSLLLTELAIVAVGTVIVGRTVMNNATVWRFFRALTAAVVMAAVMRGVSSAGYLLTALIGLVTFAVAAHLLRVLSPQDRALLRNLVVHVTARIAGRVPR